MCATIINTIGLVFGMLGVIIIFIWGPPQPTLETGVSLGLEDNTPIGAGGKSVAQHNKEVEGRKLLYSFLSKAGLAFVFIGFAFQLASIWTCS